MNEFASGRTLIIGIGNPLRCDDGLGWVVAEQLTQDGDLDCDIHVVHQLTPELAQSVASADKVIIIDANREGEPGALRVYPLSLSALPSTGSTHATTPEEIALLAESIYGRCAPIIVVTMTGADFSLGEQFSPIIAPHIPHVHKVVRQLYAHGLPM